MAALAEEEQEEKSIAGGPLEGVVYPLTVVYCGVCGMPPEFCDYGPGTKADCSAWAEANLPNLAALKISGEGAEAGQEGEDPPAEEGRRKRKSSSKKAVAAEDLVVKIARITRNKRKFVTVIGGLGAFPGIKMKDAAKRLGRRFACGSSVSKTASGAEEITIQGDVLDDLPAFLATEFNITKVHVL
ncbi:unnamed protein product [Chrysoparadoxa australica]